MGLFHLNPKKFSLQSFNLKNGGCEKFKTREESFYSLSVSKKSFPFPHFFLWRWKRFFLWRKNVGRNTFLCVNIDRKEERQHKKDGSGTETILKWIGLKTSKDVWSDLQIPKWTHWDMKSLATSHIYAQDSFIRKKAEHFEEM